jgi:RNA polymerase sigma-70 factor (ECF subfamily)
MSDTDSELLSRAHRGDARAIDELLARHEKQVYRFGLRMCGNEEDARDVLQETLLAAFRGIGEFRGDARLSTWLYQIARSFCTKARRRGVGEPERHQELEAPEVRSMASDETPPDARAHARQIGRILQSAILALPEASREVVVLRDVEGLSAEEAAGIVGVEVGALKSRLHRARLELREQLSRLMEPAASGREVCPDLARELAEYADAEIDQATCVAIEAHLAACPRCGSACDQLRRTVSLCQAVPGDEVPGPIKEAVRLALRAAVG